MPRLPKISDEEAPEELRRVFDGARELLGFVSNSTRTVAHSPWVVKWLVPFTTAIQRESGGALDAKTKELAVIRTSAVNTCHF
ncbi:MAG: carboxymuconolactone decarboxylase family protein [Candidatus Tectomicrobia bacterium]|uniref:Carboxymuconolactone decarboxylase family protein n=1 Tax=Tectimicrobiota bacterium TaxID=2528274 RepID=A0A932ZSL8_UNCTE|nr:carboxymuconolactone decarboxylase family protein [Candidatus Tectomicrobia bacterium]MBI3025397.1 carboxymuconolactone decarboxylase family protein [Candidatus Tectomicrobia bacterium]MBI4251337.1 carboxymuconolactone decarboxylase family protein [Candidatus Tectomicrobia bacterium]